MELHRLRALQALSCWRTPTSQCSTTNLVITVNGANVLAFTAESWNYKKKGKKLCSMSWPACMAWPGDSWSLRWRRSWRRKRALLTSFSMSWTLRFATTRMWRCRVPLRSSSMGQRGDLNRPWCPMWRTIEKHYMKLRNMEFKCLTRWAAGFFWGAQVSQENKSSWSKVNAPSCPTTRLWRRCTFCWAKTTKASLMMQPRSGTRDEPMGDGPTDSMATWLRRPMTPRRSTPRTMPTNNGMMMKPMVKTMVMIGMSPTMRTPTTLLTTRTRTSRTSPWMMEVNSKRHTPHTLMPGDTSPRWKLLEATSLSLPWRMGDNLCQQVHRHHEALRKAKARARARARSRGSHPCDNPIHHNVVLLPQGQMLHDASVVDKLDIGQQTALHLHQRRALRPRLPHHLQRRPRQNQLWWCATWPGKSPRDFHCLATMVSLESKMVVHRLWFAAMTSWWTSWTTWWCEACPSSASCSWQPTSCLALGVMPTENQTGLSDFQSTSKAKQATSRPSSSRAVRLSWSADRSCRRSTSRLTTTRTRSLSKTVNGKTPQWVKKESIFFSWTMDWKMTPKDITSPSTMSPARPAQRSTTMTTWLTISTSMSTSPWPTAALLRKLSWRKTPPWKKHPLKALKISKMMIPLLWGDRSPTSWSKRCTWSSTASIGVAKTPLNRCCMPIRLDAAPFGKFTVVLATCLRWCGIAVGMSWPLTTTRAGILMLQPTGKNFFNYKIKFALTSFGTAQNALIGPLFNNSMPWPKIGKWHFKLSATTTRRSTSRCVAEATWSRGVKEGMPPWSSQGMHSAGRRPHCMIFQDTNATWTSASLKWWWLMRMGWTNTSRNQHDCNALTKAWPTSFHSCAQVTTTICLLRAVHLELATVLLLLQFTKEFSAAASFRQSSTSSSTRSMSRPWWPTSVFMQVMTWPMRPHFLWSLTSRTCLRFGLTRHLRNKINMLKFDNAVESFNVWMNVIAKLQRGRSPSCTATWAIHPTGSSSGCWRPRMLDLLYYKLLKIMNVDYVTFTNVPVEYQCRACPRTPPSINEFKLTLCGWKFLGWSTSFLCWWCQMLTRDFLQLASSRPRPPRSTSSRLKLPGSASLDPWRPCKLMSTGLGHQMPCENGQLNMGSNWWFLRGNLIQDWPFWSEDIRWQEERFPSFWNPTLVSLLTRTPSSLPWPTLCRSWTGFQMCMDTAPYNGCWATRHMCPACCLRNLPSAIQHTLTPPRSSWRSCACDKRPTRPWLRPTLTSAWDVPCCESTWDNLLFFNQATCATTGETLQQDQLRSWNGVDQPPSSWENKVNMATTPTSTGSLMEQFSYVQLLNMSKLPHQSKILQNDLEIPWTQPSSLCQTSEAVVWRSTLTSPRATSADAMKLPLMRRRTSTMRTCNSTQDKSYHQTGGMCQKMEDFGLESTTFQDASSMCPSQQQMSRSTSFRGHPNPEHIRIRDEWRTPNSDRELHYVWTGTTTFFIKTDQLSDNENEYSPGTPYQGDGPDSDEEVHPGGAPHAGESEQEPPSAEASAPTTTTSPTDTSNNTRTNGLEPLPEERPPLEDLPQLQPSMSPMSQEPMAEPAIVPSVLPPPGAEVPDQQREVYEAPAGGETFAQQRARHARQESLLFRPQQPGAPAYGPQRPAEPRPTPYSEKPLSRDDALNATIDIDLLKENNLPTGWRLDKGMIVMDDIKDEWKLECNYLTRKHYVPRNSDFQLTEDNCPLPLNYFTKDRYTKMGTSLVRDRWTRPTVNKKLNSKFWTGYTRFKLAPSWRKTAQKLYMEKSDGKETMFYNEDNVNSQTTSNAPVTERNLSLDDRLTFMEAKKKELESFFNNEVWLFDDASNAPVERVLKARFILNWKKNEDGTPRAKARLVVQGFKDPDALGGTLSTASPTLTRLSRNYILTVATMMGMTIFTSDISTAFLQGRKFSPESNRTIWVKLPRDGEALLGLPPGHGKLMKLVKPMYGLCDAPRAWYEEAATRILNMGNGTIVQHPLDACLFLAYDRPVHPPPEEGADPPRLLALFGIHVDDIFGCYMDDAETEKLLNNLKSIFTFREWITSNDKNELEYCGAQITKLGDNHWKIHHEKYLTKQKPITYPKERHGSNDEVTDRERTSLRGLVGGLQWPATQTSPHLQCMVSTLAGQISKATTSTLDTANKCLRFAKQNQDAGLEFRHLGSKDEITFACYSDASFASRDDLSSQGGYLLIMTHRDVTSGGEGHYNIVDWRSWKLARVSRSTLAAESQAASEAADALLFATTFWRLIWSPWLPLDDIRTAQIPNQPKLVVDAKALFDMLVREEIQAGSSTDKRTAIEVLVTQDKLRCCNATTMWVSSELQYSDGLTKASAAQLLADRLRSHLTRLKSDEDFVASKKKSAAERKKGTEKYAIRKPPRTATATMFAAFCTSAAAAMDFDLNETYAIENKTTNTYNLNYLDSEGELFTTILAIVMGYFLVIGAIATCRWMITLPRRALATVTALWKDSDLEEAHTPEVSEMATQTDDDPLVDDLHNLLQQKLTLEALLDEAQNQVRDYERSNEDLHTVLRDYDHSRQRTIIEAAQQEVYFSPYGQAWHANYQCLRNRTTGPIYHRTWCTHCLPQLRDPREMNQPQQGQAPYRVRFGDS